MNNTGSIGESEFSTRCLRHGIAVNLPITHYSPYDALIDNGKDVYKIQVKTTTQNDQKNSYRFNCGKGSSSKNKYTSKEVDFFALYILPLNRMYIVPIDEIKTKTVRIYPDKNNHIYSKYLENFSILKK